MVLYLTFNLQLFWYFPISLPIILNYTSQYDSQWFAHSTFFICLGKQDTNPPQELVEMVTEWIFTKPSLCLMSAIAVPKLNLTPIPGLIHWCVMAPVADETMPSNGAYSDNCDEMIATSHTLYCKLHLGLLQTMLHGQEIGMRHVVGVHRFQGTMAALAQSQYSDKKASETSLNRLGQALQVAKATNLLSGNISELIKQKAVLPGNRYRVQLSLRVNEKLACKFIANDFHHVL